MTSPVRLVFVSNDRRWSAFSLFNANDFPSDLSTVVNTCGDRFALIGFHAHLAARQENEDVDRFLAALSSQGDALIEGLKQPSTLTYVACYHSIELMSSMSGTLYTVKAFLDVLAQLLARLVDPQQKRMTFRRATIDGRECSGGRLIKWLNGQNTEKHPHARPLAKWVLENSLDWITEATSYRDLLSHDAPNGFVEMSTPLQRSEPVYSRSTISRATVPNGATVGDYCEACRNRMHQFVSGTLEILPGLGRQA